MDYRDFYKSRRIISLADSLAKRVKDINDGRQEKQREFFWSKRGRPETSEPSTPVPIKKKPSRAEMLKKWKEEKTRKIEEAKKKQKPIFKVGVVQRKVTGSPIIIDRNIKRKKNLLTLKDNHPEIHLKDNENKQGVITRSRAKTMELIKSQTKQQADTGTGTINAQDNVIKFCKIDVGQKNSLDFYKFKVPQPVSELSYSMKLTFPFSPNITKKQKLVKETKCVTKSPKAYRKSPKGKTQQNSSVHNLNRGNINEDNKCEEKKEVPSTSVSPKPSTPETDDYRPIHYSPFVTKRSGKKAGKSQKKSLVRDVDEEIKQEEKVFHCRIFSFRKYIECETKRLLEKCDKWKHIYEEFQEIPTEIEGDIDSVTGKTKLLTSDKFKQFKELIDKCENGDPLINVDDLQGFQDWVSIEVEKIDEDFYKLEKKKDNNWQEETAPAEKKNEDKDQKIRKNKKVSKPAVVKSNIRSHIQAARKLLKEGGVNSNPGLVLSGFSAEGATKPATPKGKESILKDVLNSETKKKNSVLSNSSEPSPLLRERRNSGLEIMIATRKSKLSTPAKDSPAVFITKDPESVGIDQTPAKSILKKKAKKTPKSGKGHVTFKMVTENISNTGLNEKYFRPVTDVEETPVRLVLGDVGNFTPSRMSTRSRTSSKSERGVKLHIPLIKFRKGGPYTDKTSSAAASAAPSGNKPTSSSPPSLKAQQLPLIEDWQLPPHYRRTPLDEKEIDAINSGGAY